MGRGTMHTVQKVNLEGIRCNIMCRSLIADFLSILVKYNDGEEGKAVNREDKRCRRYRDRDFGISGKSRRYRDR
jgi:hypothetical protein